jgi:hypothetical protein
MKTNKLVELTPRSSLKNKIEDEDFALLYSCKPEMVGHNWSYIKSKIENPDEWPLYQNYFEVSKPRLESEILYQLEPTKKNLSIDFSYFDSSINCTATNKNIEKEVENFLFNRGFILLSSSYWHRNKDREQYILYLYKRNTRFN